jgi:hypothetical protein
LRRWKRSLGKNCRESVMLVSDAGIEFFFGEVVRMKYNESSCHYAKLAKATSTSNGFRANSQA